MLLVKFPHLVNFETFPVKDGFRLVLGYECTIGGKKRDEVIFGCDTGLRRKIDCKGKWGDD